ncbi:hypothetical protein M0R45_002612 [Rubus argutus]|uniref:Uncharacterized protein n=1 Tax=Rubus argutus TaxID=59490 RepID=A0AAW1VRX1_RUBAR
MPHSLCNQVPARAHPSPGRDQSTVVLPSLLRRCPPHLCHHTTTSRSLLPRRRTQLQASSILAPLPLKHVLQLKQSLGLSSIN